MSRVSSTDGSSQRAIGRWEQAVSLAEREQIIWTSLRQGQREALDYIFDKYVRLLYTYGNKITHDYGLVEDCIQDLFVELWNKREVLSDTAHIKFYLMKSLRRRIERRLFNDSRIHTEQLNEDDCDEFPDFSIESQIIREQSSHDQNQRLLLALEKLSKRQREAVYLKFYEHMSYEEISAIMNLTIKSTYKLIGKSIESLRKMVSLVTLVD